MADAPKICIHSTNSKNTIPGLHKELKEAIERKIKEKDWTQREKDEFRLQILKVYADTVELSLRENVIAENKDESTASVVQQEMEPINQARALEVNRMCAESEDLLTNTIKKRKVYPQKIKQCLQKRHETEFVNLFDLGKLQPHENHIQPDNQEAPSVFDEGQLDMTECETYLKKLKAGSENISLLSKALPETKDKAQRLHAATETHLRMKGSDIYQTLFNKRKTPSSFDSILKTPTKDEANDTLTETDSFVTATSLLVDEQGPSKKLKSLQKTDSPDRV